MRNLAILTWLLLTAFPVHLPADVPLPLFKPLVQTAIAKTTSMSARLATIDAIGTLGLSPSEAKCAVLSLRIIRNDLHFVPETMPASAAAPARVVPPSPLALRPVQPLCTTSVPTSPPVPSSQAPAPQPTPSHRPLKRKAKIVVPPLPVEDTCDASGAGLKPLDVSHEQYVLMSDHIVRALALTGASAIDELPEIVKLKGTDQYLDADIDNAVDQIQAAWAKANAPNTPVAQTTIPALKPFADFSQLVGKLNSPEGVLSAFLNVWNANKAATDTNTVQLIRCAASLAKVFGYPATKAINRSAYLAALVEMLGSPDDGIAITAGMDLADVGDKSNAADLLKASNDPKQSANRKAAFSTAASKLSQSSTP